MPFLMVENRVNSIPSVELLRMLGASTSRGNDNRIGFFGSGTPYALALLARYGLLESLKICLGKEVYTFHTVDRVVKDANGERSIQSELRMQKQGGASWDLNLSTAFGAVDWQNVTLAIRELISNALDGAESFDGTYNSVVIDPTISEEGRNTRAKDGVIRIYVKMTPDIEEYSEHP